MLLYVFSKINECLKNLCCRFSLYFMCMFMLSFFDIPHEALKHET